MSLPVMVFSFISGMIVIVPGLDNVIEVVSFAKSLIRNITISMINSGVVDSRIASTVSSSKLVDVINISKDIQVIFPSLDRTKFVGQKNEGMKERKFIFMHKKDVRVELSSFITYIIGIGGQWLVMGNNAIFNYDLRNSSGSVSEILNLNSNVMLRRVGNLIQAWWEMRHFDIGTLNNSLVISKGTVEPGLGNANTHQKEREKYQQPIGNSELISKPYNEFRDLSDLLLALFYTLVGGLFQWFGWSFCDSGRRLRGGLCFLCGFSLVFYGLVGFLLDWL